MRDAEFVDRQQAERNINLRNQHSFQDNINEKQEHQLSERRAIEKNTEKSIYLKKLLIVIKFLMKIMKKPLIISQSEIICN